MRTMLLSTSGLVLFSFLLQANLHAEEEIVPVYVFQDHLQEAEALSITRIPAKTNYEKPQLKEVFAQWDQDRFIFKGVSGEYPIEVQTHAYAGRNEKAILFYPKEDATKVLRFYGVAPSPRLAVFYGINDEAIALQKDTSVFLTVWIGNQKVARLHALSEPGWKRSIIDLGPVAYLNQPIAVTFEVTTTNEDSSFFSFSASMLK